MRRLSSVCLTVAIIQMSIHDMSIVPRPSQLYPLEVVLSAWFDMIDAGKVQAVASKIEVDNGKLDPWILLPYSQQQLQETLPEHPGAATIHPPNSWIISSEASPCEYKSLC